MDKKFLIIGLLLIVCLVFSGIIIYTPSNVGESSDIVEENKQRYQGPVPEGFDEEYFRETGITKPIE